MRTTGSNLRAKYDFRWEVLEVIISGRSSIDSSAGFHLQDLEEVDRFVQSYGYDLENPIEKAEILGNYQESLNFVRKYFLAPENPDGLKIDVPRKLQELTDVRELFLMASMALPGQQNDTPGLMLQNWACSLLKVMHTIAHIDKDLRSSHFSDIQQQIFDRFYKIVQRDEAGSLFLGSGKDDPHRVDLIAFETKPKKTRESSILKLLHKPENVAEDIFDRVGIRFVTVTLLDALRVVKYLKDKTIVMPPNIKPSRSRNTLIDLESFREGLGEVLARVEVGALDEAALVQRLGEITRAPTVNPENPHSSEFYRAIQFTCRQLIKLRNPLYTDLRDLKQAGRTKKVDEDLQKMLDRIDLKYLQRESRFFYPFEVQVVDRHSAEENERGRSAHSEYKRAQVQTALKRVMELSRMSLDSDVALFGTGVAPLVAASHLLSQGRSVLLLNPDHDFFLEDSELPLDPILMGDPDAAARIRASAPERVLEELRPDFPGAVELWAGVAAQSSPKVKLRDDAAPHVRARARLWLTPGLGADPDEVARARERLEDLYVECSDLELKPTLLEGLPAARRFPGFTALSAAGPEAGAQGLLVPRGCDFDVSRYRYGLLEFVRERLGPERLVCSTTQVERMPGGLRFHAEGGARTAKIAESLIVFWTPRLTRWVLEQAKRLGRPPAFQPRGMRLWEQWTLVSRDALDPYALGTYDDMTVWAELEGAPDVIPETSRLSVLRLSGLEWAASDSFSSIRKLCLGLMRWDRVSIRGMRPRAILDWEDGARAFALGPSGESARSIVVPACDGPLSRVVRAARSAGGAVS